MEGSHGELRTRFAYRLGGYDTDRFTYADHASACHILAVTLRANAEFRVTGKHGSDFDRSNARRRDFLGFVLAYHLVHCDDDVLFVLGMHDVFRRDSARESVFQTFYYLVAFHDCGSDYAARRGTFAAVLFAHDDVLRNVDKTARKITGVGGFKRGIRKTFTSAVAGNEVFQSAESFTEGRTDGRFQSFTLRVGH